MLGYLTPEETKAVLYSENEYNNLANYPLSIPFWENYQRDEVQI